MVTGWFLLSPGNVAAAISRPKQMPNPSVTERYLRADATRLLAVLDGAGTQLYRFLYADSRVPFAADTPQGRIFFSYDQVGSLRAVTDASGAVLETRAHDSFGNVIGPSAPATRSPLGFAGGLTDSDTGLVLFGARDFDPTLGRWLAKDPIGFAGGDVNLYGYCLGDPVGLVDPSGYEPHGFGTPDGYGGGYGYGYAQSVAEAAWKSIESAGTPVAASTFRPNDYYQDFNVSSRGWSGGVIWNRTERGCKTESVYAYFGPAHGVSWPPWGSASIMYHAGRTSPGWYAENAGGVVGGAAVGTQLYDLNTRRWTLDNYTQEGGSTPSFGGQSFVVFPWDLSGLSESSR